LPPCTNCELEKERRSEERGRYDLEELETVARSLAAAGVLEKEREGERERKGVCVCVCAFEMQNCNLAKHGKNTLRRND